MRAVAAACLALVLAGGAPARETATPTLAQLVGQKLVVSMNGTTPSASLLRRVRRGDVGGVIVHRFNFGSSAQLRRITRTLQRAAVAAGRPKLLMAVDQEGGRVKTVPWAPPTLPPARIGARAGEQGRRTGAALRAPGVNVDLAPVADLPASRASAVYRQGRTWSFDAQETARRAAAFARGLRGGRVVATTKHFSGLGVARRDTDRALVRISGAKRRLAGPGPVPSGVSRPRAGAGTASFTDRSYDIGDQPVTGIALFPATGDVYAATDFDVLRLPAGASHWETAGSGLPTAAVYGLTLSQSANVLYAATHGRGAWALTLPRP